MLFFDSKNLIHIATEKLQYYPGDIIRGSVSLTIIEPIHIDSVFIKIKGFEEVSFTEIVTTTTVGKGGGTSQRSVRRHEIEVFMKRKYCIHNYKCTLPTGNFVFPFEFQLEHRLPGTFTFKDQGNQGSIRFKIKAEVTIPGFFKSNIRHSQNILICQPLDSVLMSFNSYKESNVTFLCCIPKGKVTVAANIDRNAYGPGDLVNVRLIVDNSASKVDLDGCDLKLIQNVNLNAEGRNRFVSKMIAETKSAHVKKGDNADRIIQLVIPKNAGPSTNGNLIQCSYDLQVSMVVPWSLDVNLKQPVQIFAPVQQIIPPPPPPLILSTDEWSNPTVMPVIKLDDIQYQKY